MGLTTTFIGDSYASAVAGVDPFPGWQETDTVSIDNTDGVALTDYPICIHLTAVNFDFTKADSNGADIRFQQGVTSLSYWIQSYDNGGEDAVIWVKVPTIDADTVSQVQLRYGNNAASSESNGSNVFSYYNALEDAADLAALNLSLGSATPTVETDAASPTGKCIEIDAVDEHNALGQAATLPGQYASHVWLSDEEIVGNNSAWAGSLVNCADMNNWYGSGTRTHPTNGAGVVYRNNAGSVDFTPPGIMAFADGAAIVPGTYYEQYIAYQPARSVSQTATFDTSSEITTGRLQGVETDGTNVYAIGSEEVARYNAAGSVQETADHSATNAVSWGDLALKGGDLYVADFNEGTTSKVYVWSDPTTDLASVPTLFKDVTSIMPAGWEGLNGLHWTGAVWLLGETGTGIGNTRLAVLNEAMTSLLATIALPDSTNNGGVQSITMDGTQVYAVMHDDNLLVGSWDAVLYEINWHSIISHGVSTGQGIAWDSVNSNFRMCDRANDAILTVTFPSHGSNKQLSAFFRDSVQSVGAFRYTLPALNSNTNAGVRCFRTARFAQLFVRQQAVPEPVATVA